MSRLVEAVFRHFRSSRLQRMQDLELGLSRAAPRLVNLDLSSLDVIEWVPAALTHAERLMLFTLVCGLRPTRYLEIGTFQGGSSLVVSAAMTATKHRGRMLCVDPKPQIDPVHWALIEERATLIQGYSPDILPRARDAAGGPFDLVFVDGDHTARGVYRDAIGVLPFLQQGACMLFHDGHFPDVAFGINRFASERAGHLLDFGIITREATVEAGDATVHWGGLRLMRVLR